MPKQKIDKEELLRLCWSVLHRQGYHHTSLRDLSQATGLGKAGLLHHFGSKEGLMRAVMDFAARWYGDNVLAVAEEDLPLEQRLEKLLRRHNRLAKIDGRGCFFGNTVLETSQEGIFNERIEVFFAEWQSALAHLLTGPLAAEQARDFAYLTLVEYQGATTLYKLHRDEAHLERFVHRTLARFNHQRHAEV